MKITLPSTSKMQSDQFTFGVATASFQIEGGSDTRLPSIWDTFCDTPNAIADKSDGKTACDHINKWQEDIDLIVSLGVDAYRFSISWPRVIHQNGSLNTQGIQFYIDLLDKLEQHNIKAYVTLYHWDLPQYLEDDGGWLNRDTAYHFANYANLVSQALGDRVHSYSTLNEPFCSAFLGYEVGIHAPGLKNKDYGKKAAHHLLLAHGLAMTILKKNSPNSQCGIVLNFTPAYAQDNNPDNIAAAKRADDYFNQWYIKPIMDGSYPALIDELPESQRPDIKADDMAIISHPLDYLGVNYYTRANYRADSTNSYGFVDVPPNNVPVTDMGWEINPHAFTELLVSLNQTYQLPPLIITENGAAMPDTIQNGEVNDIDRIEYFQQHLLAVHQAIEQGVNIEGYFAWSLMDNFEWAEGYLKRFGIVYVDYVSQKRTIKASGYAYKDFISQR
ncbi:MAG: beta-glucosidase [Phenylobacterium sp.]|jgi:beta-glucosidase